MNSLKLLVLASLVASATAFAQVGVDKKIESTRAALPKASEIYQRTLSSALFTTSNGQMTALAVQLRSTLQNSARQGLKPANYLTPALVSYYTSGVNAQNSAAFEAEAMQALLKYSRDLSVGQVDPNDVGAEIKITPRALDAVALSAALIMPGDLQTNLDSLQPQYPQYAKLVKALALFRQIPQSAFPAFEKPRKSLKVGSSDPAVSAVKIRLHTLGFAISEAGPVVTDEMNAAVVHYMQLQDLATSAELAKKAVNPSVADLTIKSTFWDHIGTSLESRIDQIQLSMEKLRWLPAPDSRYVFVNLAFQHLRVFENNQVVLEMNTVNGRPDRMSPMLHDKVVDVELNPTWTVPPKLLLQDKIPHILKDSSYLSQNNYTILNASGSHEVFSMFVDWRSITAHTAGKYVLRQGPGLGNALGIVKFNLTNPYAIYMHDTNERDLFGNNFRLLSSGCIRLQQPLVMAAYLLRDQPNYNSVEMITPYLSTTQWADSSIKAEQHIRLTKAVTVNTAYLTTDVDEAGHVSFVNDSYGQDASLAALLKAQ